MFVLLQDIYNKYGEENFGTDYTFKDLYPSPSELLDIADEKLQERIDKKAEKMKEILDPEARAKAGGLPL
jgi:hypothetical protein